MLLITTKRKNFIFGRKLIQTNWAFEFRVDIFNVSFMGFDVVVGFGFSFETVVLVLLGVRGLLLILNNRSHIKLFGKQVGQEKLPKPFHHLNHIFETFCWVLTTLN